MTDTFDSYIDSETMPRLKPTRPRARRYCLAAKIELTDLQAETQIKGQTKDLSLYGCYASTQIILPIGTSVRIRIIHSRGNFTSLGRIVHGKPHGGMGVVFTKVERNQELVLERWIAEVRGTARA